MSDNKTTHNYIGLKSYLDSLVEDFKLHLVVKDFVGFLEEDKALYEALKDYTIHKTSYCMAVKEGLWKYCLYTNKLLYKRLQKKTEPFTHHCYTGVMEYIIPICYNKQVIGAITVACDRLDKKAMQNILEKFNKYNQINTQYLYELYNISFSDKPLSEEVLLKRLAILAEYIGFIYDPNKKTKLNNTSIASQTYIMSHALAYLNERYKEDISLDELARYCHCSTSYLSHHFKEYTGVTLKTYVNQLRTEEAKTLLIESSTPVTQIAYKLGYKDSNYFSKVFKDIVGISPVYYRANHKNIN